MLQAVVITIYCMLQAVVITIYCMLQVVVITIYCMLQAVVIYCILQAVVITIYCMLQGVASIEERFELLLEQTDTYLNMCVFCHVPEKRDKQNRVMKAAADVLLGYVSIHYTEIFN